MNFAYLTPNDWQEFIDRYSPAYYFLLERVHNNEKRILAHELEQTYLRPERRAWIESRLADLTQSWLRTPTTNQTPG